MALRTKDALLRASLAVLSIFFFVHVVRCSALPPLPDFDGRVILSGSLLKPYSEDFGLLIHKTPLGALEPANIEDVVKMVKYCYANNLEIVARGMGHDPFGQALVCVSIPHVNNYV